MVTNTVVTWYHGVRNHGVIGSWCKTQWCHGFLMSDTMVSWYLGVLPWVHGNLV